MRPLDEVDQALDRQALDQDDLKAKVKAHKTWLTIAIILVIVSMTLCIVALVLSICGIQIELEAVCGEHQCPLLSRAPGHQ